MAQQKEGIVNWIYEQKWEKINCSYEQERTKS